MLASIFNVPNDERSLSIWSFHNYDSHDRIIGAIFNQGGALLTRYPLDPISTQDPGDWLRTHQTMHNDMNAQLGLSGSDLTDVNWEDPRELEAWSFLHAVEHRAAENQLGIG